MDNYFLLWVKCCIIIINFIAQIVPAVAIRRSFKVAPVPFRLMLFLQGVIRGGLLLFSCSVLSASLRPCGL